MTRISINAKIQFMWLRHKYSFIFGSPDCSKKHRNVTSMTIRKVFTKEVGSSLGQGPDSYVNECKTYKDLNQFKKTSLPLGGKKWVKIWNTLTDFPSLPQNKWSDFTSGSGPGPSNVQTLHSESPLKTLVSSHMSSSSVESLLLCSRDDKESVVGGQT